jgi:hypothetical protein
VEDNPFAPPTASDEASPDGLVFSPDGALVVASLSKWMRVLGIFYYIGAAMVAVGGVFFLFSAQSGGFGAFAAAVFLAVALLVGLGGLWLSSAGSDFERGVLSDDEVPLGSGFRSLRAYFILMGLLGLTQLGVQLFAVARAWG